MICQFCEIEYAAGTKVCTECDSELVEALPPESDEIVLEPLGVVYKRKQLAHLVDRFETLGIPYVVYSGTALAMVESQAVANAAFRSEWEARVMVMSSRRTEAGVSWKETEALFKAEPDDDFDQEGSEELEDPASPGPNREIAPR